jgi:hypothetical protein
LIISVEALDRIFEQNNDQQQYIYRGECHDCGCAVKIEIHKTSVGYGLLGGVLCAPNTQKIFALCTDCYEKL